MFARLLVLGGLCLLPPQIWAGRPFFTDDATLTRAHSCQLETWWQASGTRREWWALPACNPSGNFEVTAGLASLRERDSARAQTYVLQGKTLLRTLEAGSFGLGLAFGATRSEGGGGGTAYAYVPFSLVSHTGRTAAHLNLGMLRERGSGARRANWGFGIGHAWGERVSGFGEVFGESAADPVIHFGLSLVLIPERLQLDATWGRGTGPTGEGFVTLGVNLYLPPR